VAATRAGPLSISALHIKRSNGVAYQAEPDMPGLGSLTLLLLSTVDSYLMIIWPATSGILVAWEARTQAGPKFVTTEGQTGASFR
jgi:hypothetical protein